MTFFGWLFRDPFRRQRPKSTPPVNYNPNGMWRDYFNVDVEEKQMKVPDTMEDRDHIIKFRR
jgi:hypothetical protein